MSVALQNAREMSPRRWRGRACAPFVICCGAAIVLLILLLFASLNASNRALAQDAASDPALTPVNKEQIDAALKLTTAEAGKYAFTLQDEARTSARLRQEPVLRWSNPAVGEIHGNVFLWTVDDQPAVVGSLFKWFTPHTHMSHEFHSLAEVPLAGQYDAADAWTAGEPGVKFVELPRAPPPAESAAQRLLQMKRLVKDFAVAKTERDGNKQELRLLTQPIYRYAAPARQILDGALFAFVQGTDPDVFLLVEARGAPGAETWQFAPARMNSVEFVLRHQDREVWKAEILSSSDVYRHAQPYTSFFIKMASP